MAELVSQDKCSSCQIASRDEAFLTMACVVLIYFTKQVLLSYMGKLTPVSGPKYRVVSSCLFFFMPRNTGLHVLLTHDWQNFGWCHIYVTFSEKFEIQCMCLMWYLICKRDVWNMCLISYRISVRHVWNMCIIWCLMCVRDVCIFRSLFKVSEKKMLSSKAHVKPPICTWCLNNFLNSWFMWLL